MTRIFLCLKHSEVSQRPKFSMYRQFLPILRHNLHRISQTLFDHHVERGSVDSLPAGHLIVNSRVSQFVFVERR